MTSINKYQFRYQIISLLSRHFCTAMDTAWELNLSIRHIRRLLAVFRASKKKLSALQPKTRPLAWNGKTQNIIDEIIRLKKENPARSNQYISERATDKFLMAISHSTVRRILINNDCYEKTEKEKRFFENLEAKITRSANSVILFYCYSCISENLNLQKKKNYRRKKICWDIFIFTILV